MLLNPVLHQNKINFIKNSNEENQSGFFKNLIKVMRKIKFNWNLVTVLLAIITIIVTLQIISNQSNVDLLNTRIEDLKSENLNLKEQLDPSWYKRFNEQKEYYEGRIAQKDSQMKSKVDSIIYSYNIVRKDNKNQFILKRGQLDTIGIALLKGLEYKELYYNEVELTDNLKEITILKDLLINHKDSIINVYAEYINNNREEWNILGFNITQIMLSFVVLILIVNIIVKTKKNINVKPNENQN